jgi:hypothetical protein
MKPPPKKILENLELSGVKAESLLLVDENRRAWEQDLNNENGKASWKKAKRTWSTSTKGIRILVVTPEHPGYGIRPQARESIQAAINNYDGPIDWIISRGDNPYINTFENVTYQHNKARQIVLAGGYDALLSLEADMIVPPDTIAQLIEADSDIAYGLYLSRHKPYRWLVYKELDLWGGVSISRDHTGKDARETWGKIIDAAGVGMGCTLIRADVLKVLRFRLHDGKHSWIQDEYAEDFRRLGINPYGDRKNMVCDDYLLAMDAQHYGMSQRANMNLVCGHIAKEGVYWPDPTVRKLYRVDSLEEAPDRCKE